MAATQARDVSAEISRLIIRLFSEYTGRGPVSARTSIDGDLVTTVLRDTLTKGEHRLVDAGRAATVLELREAYQATMRDELVAGVQEILGREIEAFLSGNHLDPDVAVETFVLRAEGG
jgi:uncharacterized protein YbcI